MSALPLYQIDAFSRRVFGGNPAALVPLESWLPDATLQAIAAENKLSETAYFVPDSESGSDFALRWFTPRAEVELCGHATLATAWWLFEHGGWERPELRFRTRSGVLRAKRSGQGVEIDLPARASQDDPSHLDRLSAALGQVPLLVRRGANLLAVFADEATVQNLKPDFSALRRLHPYGVIVTAPGQQCDLVSRYFAPSYGIDEDPVTGSAHADLAPYWAQRLGKSELQARQLSERGGELEIRLDADRVHLRGDCVLYLRGEIFLND